MTEKENEEQYLRMRSRYQQRKKNNKLDKLLNYLIALVVVLIAVALFIIFSTEPEKVDSVAEQPSNMVTGTGDELSEKDVPAAVDKDVAPNDESKADIEEQETLTTGKDVKVEQVDDGIVSERWTSKSWEPYPTDQEGPHASVYQKGHIDYEEKLGAIYSVVPLKQSESILLKIQNNGSPQTSRAIVTSTDKTEIYRVFIEWVDSKGWQPTMVEVLTSLESIE